MAYDTANPPVKVWNTLAGNSGWIYTDTDVASDVDAANYFSNGYALGMRQGDVVHLIETDNSYIIVMAYVSASTAGGASTVITI